MKNKKIIILFIITFLIRLISLNQSLWLDEATTAKVVQTYSYLHIITKFSPFDFHPPLYYLMMKFWTSIFGFSEISLRMPSVIFSLLTGYVIYLIGKKIQSSPSTPSTLLRTSSLRTNFSNKSEKFGIWSAVFFLFNPLIVYYSQEARMYMMATFFLTCALYFFISNIKNQISKIHIKNQIFFNLFILLSLSTFYGSVFLVVAFLIYFLFKKKYAHLFICLFVVFVYFLLISPLLIKQFIHARQSLQIVMNWRQVLGTASLKNLLLFPIKFSGGRISFNPKLVYYGLSGLWAFFICLAVFKGGLKNKLLLFLLIFPLMLGLAFSFFSPLLQYFRFLYLVSIMSILLAFFVEKQKVKLATVYRYVVAIGFLFFSLLYLLIPQFHREDWKSLSKSLSQIHSIYMIIPSSDPVRYYAPTVTIRELRSLDGIELEKQVVVIPYTTDIYGFDYKKELLKHGFTYKETKSFRGVWYEIWVKNKAYAGSFLYSFTETYVRIPIAENKAIKIAKGGPKTPYLGIRT